MKSKALAIVPPEPEERTKRLVADVPERIHRAVRVRCMQRGILVRDYLVELLRRDGIH